LDPLFGLGTTGLVALKNARKFIGIELNGDYCKLAEERLLPYLQQTSMPEYIIA
jgi:DNA modification methylase